MRLEKRATRSTVRFLISILFLLLIVAFIPISPVTASSPSVDYVRQFGTEQQDLSTILSVDSSGAYIIGLTLGNFPGFVTAGDYDIFVRKYDLAGDEIWTEQFGTNKVEIPVDSFAYSSSLYIVGGTFGSFPGYTNPSDTSDAFVRKLGPDGNELWTKQFGTTEYDSATDVIASSDGLYVVGSTGGILDGQANLGASDIFVRKLDFDGNEIWTRQFGTAMGEDATGVTFASGYLFVMGITSGVMTGEGSKGGQDSFLRKYDPDGNEIWTLQFGTSDTDSAQDISSDSSGIYVSGSTTGAFAGFTPKGSIDAFLQKYDFNGEELWTRQIGNEASEENIGVYADANGVYVTGDTTGVLPGQTASGGGNDIYLIVYDSDGNRIFTTQFGTSLFDEPADIEADSNGIFISGRTFGTLSGQSNFGLDDAFFMRFDKGDFGDVELFCGRDIDEFGQIIKGTPQSDLLDGTEEEDLIRGFGGDDTIDGKGGDDCIVGNGGDDILIGGTGDDSIYGGNGNDKLFGNEGNDILYGNQGNDLISGGTGVDYIAGKSGNDEVFGNDGNDILFGNEGDDFVKGGDGDDIMFGGDGNDKLAGNTGADRMSGQRGNDVLQGGRGDDNLRGGHGFDEHDGGRGDDTCYGDNFDLAHPIFFSCEKIIVLPTEVCTVEDIDFRDIREISPFVAKRTLTLHSIMDTFEVGLDYYVVEDGELKTFLQDFDSKDPAEINLKEGRIMSFDIGSTSPDVVIVMLVDESISDCDIVANMFGIPEDSKNVLSVIDVAHRIDFDYEVLVEIPETSTVNPIFTKLVIFYTESPETAVFYITPRTAIIPE